MQEHHAGRLARAREALGEAGIKWLWVEPSVTFRYLTGSDPLSMERPMALLVSASGELRLLVPELLRDEVDDLPAEPIVWTDTDGPEDAIEQALSGVVTLHVQSSLPFGVADLLQDAGGVTLRLDTGTVGRLREKKDDIELRSLRAAARAADDIVAWAPAQAGEEVTETLLSARMQGRFLDRGMQPWPALVAVGGNAAMPHHGGDDTVVDGSTATLFDTGCAAEGYWSDITRVAFPSEGTAEVQEAYALVRQAYEAAFDAVAPGVTCDEVDRAARVVIEEAGFGERFIHRTGHGVGLELHEAPYIRAGNDQALEEGHVFTIEPGVYVPGRFGVRFENTVVVTAAGAESLNQAPESLSFGATTDQPAKPEA